MKIKDWKALQRHPISAEYRDLSGDKWDRFVGKLKKLGIINGRKITMHEGQILDGWQLQRACIQLGIKPDYQELPTGIGPREFVEVENDERRHETPEEASERIAARRERVAQARSEGKSLRTIAAIEGVKKDTIASDLKQAQLSTPRQLNGDAETNSVVPNGTTETQETLEISQIEPKKVVGTDGKTYSAKKPSKPKPAEKKRDVEPANAVTNDEEANMKHLQEKGTKTLRDAVDNKEVSINDAFSVMFNPPDVQDAVVRMLRTGAARSALAALALIESDSLASRNPPAQANSNKSGAPIFDDRIVHGLIVKLTKAFDDRANAMGKCAEHENCINAMDGVVSRWNQWQVKTK